MRTLLVSLLLVVAACGSPGQDIDQAGCQYLEAGPFTPVTAGTARDATAPAIATDHRAYTTTLPAAGTGYLQFDSLDDTEYAAFLDRMVWLAVLACAGVAIPPSAIGTRSRECTTVMGRYIVELPVAQFYIALGPDAGGPVNLVIEPYNPD
jgi:hypothetical protein